MNAIEIRGLCKSYGDFALTTFFGSTPEGFAPTLDLARLAPMLLAVAVVVFVLSWLVSVRVYRKREL